jgi:hypothetical protein
VNGGEFVDATITLVETKSKGSLALMGPNGGITKPSGWQPVIAARVVVYKLHKLGDAPVISWK